MKDRTATMRGSEKTKGSGVAHAKNVQQSYSQ